MLRDVNTGGVGVGVPVVGKIEAAWLLFFPAKLLASLLRRESRMTVLPCWLSGSPSFLSGLRVAMSGSGRMVR